MCPHKCIIRFYYMPGAVNYNTPFDDNQYYQKEQKIMRRYITVVCLRCSHVCSIDDGLIIYYIGMNIQ